MADEKNDGWKKVEINPTWDYQEQPEFTGTYMAKESEVGPNNSNMYTFKVTDGSLMGVWGNTILDGRFKNLQVGEEVKIVYLGKMESSKVKGREYHNFEVYHKEVPMTKVGDEKVKEDELPF